MCVCVCVCVRMYVCVHLRMHVCVCFKGSSKAEIYITLRLLGVDSHAIKRLLGRRTVKPLASQQHQGCYQFFPFCFRLACDLPILIWIFIFSGILVALLLIDEDDGAQDDHLCHDAKEWPQCCQLV